MRRVTMLTALLLLCSICGFAQKQLAVTRRITLGGEGGWDYLTLDAPAHRLFITRGTHVMVVDTGTLQITADISDTPGVHGVALVPDVGRAFISNGGDNTVSVVDLGTLKPLQRIKVGERPDAIIYDPFSKRVFTFNARGHDTTAIDAAKATVAGTLALGGKPEFAVSDGKGTVFVNIEDSSEIVAFNAANLRVLNRWSIKPCEEPSALAIDVANKRLFSGCRNKMMTVVNADSGKVVTTVPIGEGVDAGVFDPAAQRVFMSNGDGTLSIIHEDSPDKYSVVQTLPTARGARTLAYDPDKSIVYLVTAQFESSEGQGRRTTKPGSFELIVVAPR